MRRTPPAVTVRRAPIPLRLLFMPSVRITIQFLLLPPSLRNNVGKSFLLMISTSTSPSLSISANATPRMGFLFAKSDHLRDIDKGLALDTPQEIGWFGKGIIRVDLSHLGVRVTEGHPDVQPSVVVEIKQLRSPAAVFVTELCQTLQDRYILKSVGTLIFVERLVLFHPVGDQNIHQTIVVVITHCHAHGALRIAVSVHGKSRFIAGLPKCPIAIVNVKEIRTRIVDLVDVLKTVVVKVSEHNPKTPAEILLRAEKSRSFRHIGESPIAIIVIEDALFPGIVVGGTCNGNFLQPAGVRVSRLGR